MVVKRKIVELYKSLIAFFCFEVLAKQFVIDNAMNIIVSSGVNICGCNIAMIVLSIYTFTPDPFKHNITRKYS